MLPIAGNAKMLTMHFLNVETLKADSVIYASYSLNAESAIHTSYIWKSCMLIQHAYYIMEIIS